MNNKATYKEEIINGIRINERNRFSNIYPYPETLNEWQKWFSKIGIKSVLTHIKVSNGRGKVRTMWAIFREDMKYSTKIKGELNG